MMDGLQRSAPAAIEAFQGEGGALGRLVRAAFRRTMAIAAFLAPLGSGDSWVRPVGELLEHTLAGCQRPPSVLLLGFGDRSLNQVVIWRPLTHGIRPCRITGQGKGLAAASAKILEAPVAASTRFRHPVEAPELVKGGGLAPYPPQAEVSHVLEMERPDG